MYVYKQEPGQPKLYVNAPIVEPVIKTGYIDFSDLRYCLSLYYKGLLDDVDNYLTRIYMQPRDLCPGNSLYGLLDTELMEEALSSLPEDYEAVIEINFIQSPSASETLQHHYVHSETPLPFSTWIEDLYCDAIHELTEQIRLLI
ncbi:hypothetical protein H6G04_27065 [Calothrix membranacea FACHB-236]|nr:hypothetical protein [Calothrix membranacea FACHB-236]